MKHPWLFRTSILLNVVLLGVGGWWLADRPAPPPRPALTVSNEPIPASSAPTLAFRWSQLEAGDYPTYIARLRAVGCPEETIRDLITADVASQYEEKRRQLLAANPSQPGGPVLFPTAPSPVIEPHPPTAGGSSAPLGAGDHPAASTPTAQMVQSLAQEQAALLSTLLPSPTPASQTAPVASDAAGQSAVVAGTLPAEVPARPSTTDKPPRSMEREMRQRGVLTHEQEVLRAKVGWQAFYYTTAEESAQERAAGAAR